MKKIEGVVVWYNPDDSVIQNLLSYAGMVQKLYIVDNSDVLNDTIIHLVAGIDNCVYINNQGNKGIAHALNVGAKMAIESGADWLLTMDQDSKFEEDNLLRLIQYVNDQNEREVGLVSPYHQTEVSKPPKKDIEELYIVMTSGNILSLFAYQQIGGFNESFFIDVVDWEYCLRLNRKNFKVIRHNKIYLKHNLGNPTIITNKKGKKVIVLNYNRIRRYYITRNKLFVIFKYWAIYPGIVYAFITSFFVDIKHIFLYESDKNKKLNSVMWGSLHFLLNKKGKWR
jgi:rhamnosyltransferase